ncbi:MAG: hypothetical protein V7K57_05490 [Nostoc sp.]|uniref:hypothetical protein n=1 Tax=Nostoc sp. TaxID=1180 RepID=UPI002FF4C9FA
MISLPVALYKVIDLEFEWDNQKASLNINKHRISFEAAKTVFNASEGSWGKITPNSCREAINRVSML